MIFDSNPWWKNNQVPDELCGQFRPILKKIKPLMPHRQMVLITGVRRTGKSTLMYQMIRELLQSGVPETHLFYFSFDVQVDSISNLLKQYRDEVLQHSFDEIPVTLFLDEIQKVKDWENQIKQLYDRYPKLKIILSGSAQLTMLRGSRESLAGRFFEIRVNPADFLEYLQFQRKEIGIEKEKVFELELKTLFKSYLETGGFIDCFSLSPLLQRQYLKEGVLDQILFRDIPQVWPVQSPNALSQIMRILASHIGLYLDYKSLGNDLNLDQRTVATYVDYLDLTLLIQKCYNYSSNQLTSEKKLKRIYLGNVGFSLALNPSASFSQLCEQYFINILHARYFYRSPRQEEVDIILVKEGEIILPVEVKIRNKIDLSDLKPLISFMKRHNCPKGIVITQDTDSIFSLADERKIIAMPYWRYHTLMGLLEHYQNV
jgi:predicted AAA+ superfamily ATPase